MLIAFVLAAGVWAAPGDPSLDPQVRARVERSPKAISAFIERRANCNHFLGEEPYDRARATELNRTIRELRCARIDRDEQRLRKVYRNKPSVLQLLDDTADALGW